MKLIDVIQVWNPIMAECMKTNADKIGHIIEMELSTDNTYTGMSSESNIPFNGTLPERFNKVLINNYMIIYNEETKGCLLLSKKEAYNVTEYQVTPNDTKLGFELNVKEGVIHLRFSNTYHSIEVDGDVLAVDKTSITRTFSANPADVRILQANQHNVVKEAILKIFMELDKKEESLYKRAKRVVEIADNAYTAINR